MTKIKRIDRHRSVRELIMEHAVRLLMRRNHTELELKRKLGRHGYDLEAIEDVILKCRRLKYIDDASTAHLFVIECKRKHKGPFYIRQAMLKKGFTPENIERALRDEYAFDEELKNAEIAVSKKSRRFSAAIDRSAKKQKLYAYLYSRGFSPEAIAKILEAH